MYLSKAIEGYKISKLSNGMAKNTILGYSTHFDQLVDFLGDVEIETISLDQLQAFMRYLREEYVPKRMSGDTSPYKSTTIRNAWCAIRSLFSWAHEALEIDRPDLGLKMPKVSLPDVQPFTREEINKLLKAAVFSTVKDSVRNRTFRRRNRSGKRNKAIILLLLDTGVRVSECAALRAKDVNFANGELFVRPLQASSKNRSRTLRLGAATSKAVWSYLSERKEEFPNDPLFLSSQNRPMNRSSIRQMVRRVGEEAGVPNVYPHRFRHTFAIMFLRNGGDVFSLQHSLGHTDWAMTRHYANLAKSDLANTHRRASPVDNWRL